MEFAVPDDVRWLVSPAGLAAIDHAYARLERGDDPLVVNMDLRRQVPQQLVPLALQAAQARQRATGQWPHASRLVFLREALEQASDPRVAAWRAHRWRGSPQLWDVTAGIGGDALAMAHTAQSVVAVDRDPGRLAILRHNAHVLGVPVECLLGDALDIAIAPQVAVHADPSRRHNGTRVSGLRHVQPAVDALFAQHQLVSHWSIATSPAISWTDPVLRDGHPTIDSATHELEFVQIGHDLVEATWWVGGSHPRPATSATIIASTVSADPFSDHVESFLPWGGAPSSDRLWAHRLHNTLAWRDLTDHAAAFPPVAVAPLGNVLLEIAPAAVRARLHDRLAIELGAWRIDAHRALLSADAVPGSSLWVTAHVIDTVLPADAKAIRRWLRNHDDAPIEIAVFGMNADPIDWWRRIGKPRRGPQGRRIALVRLTDRSVAIVTRAVEG